MKVGYLIIGRLKSTRLPKKILLPVADKPFLEHMFDHVRLSKRTDVVVLCTSTNSEDDPLEACAKRCGVECFRGDEDDVVKRLYDAAVKYNLDYILTITADCPLVDWQYADKVVEAFEKTKADLITAMDLPHGAFTHGMKPAALKKILEIKDTRDSEVWGRYFSDTGLFETFRMPIENKKHRRPDIRMTLDYKEDYEFFKAVFAALYKSGKVFSLDETIDYLDAHPEVLTINRDCAQLYLTRYTQQSEIKLKPRFDIKRIAVFGCGSIGQRHIKNLKALGIKDIVALRTRQGHHQFLDSALGVHEVSDFKALLDFKPDAAIISNPTSLHVQTAMQIAPHVKGVFIEKPISSTSQGLEALQDLFKQQMVVGFMGYNLQFHPIVKKMREELDKGYLGKVLSFQGQVGQWLPGWHPYEDYAKTYAARGDLGGGVSLSLIHEINLAIRLLGPAQKVAAFFTPSEKLKLNVDVIADLMIHHHKQGVSHVHLDYIQDPKSRSGVVLCEQGRLSYDFVKGQLIVDAKDRVNQVLWQEAAYDYDLMYKEQLALFLRYTAEGRMKNDFDLTHGAADVSIVESAFESSKKSQVMEL